MTTLVAHNGGDIQVGQEFLDVLHTTARQTDVLRILFRACDDPRFVVGGQPHCLSFVEFGILKGCHSEQPVSESRRQTVLRDVDLVT